MRQLFSLKAFCSGRECKEAAEEGREAADALLRDGAKNNKVLKNSGIVSGEGSDSFAAACSQRGEKGVNQDCSIVCKEFGCQEDLIFCGIFDGHGSWGHYVARKTRNSLPSSLLCNWQKSLALTSSLKDNGTSINHYEIWKESFLKSCAAVDKELEENTELDSFNSGTTALSIVKQGELLVVANVGDSRAVMATKVDDGRLVPVQLTVDFKPNLPQAERITQCNGRVFCLGDEPGVHRVWLPNEDMPGLAMSRAFGDYCLKDFGLISIPEVTQRLITGTDQFIVLATDGVWDVISNQEAVDIVSSTKDRRKSARKLVKCAIQAWKDKKRGIALDDCSAICIFFHSSYP